MHFTAICSSEVDVTHSYVYYQDRGNLINLNIVTIQRTACTWPARVISKQEAQRRKRRWLPFLEMVNGCEILSHENDTT